MRYSALLGGLVNSAAMSALLGKGLEQDPETATTVAANFLLSDMAMIVRDGVLVVIFSWSLGLQASIIPVMVLFTMVLAAGATAIFVILQSEKKRQQAPHNLPLHSPLSLSAVLTFGLLFLSLTVASGLGQKFFGAAGFLAVVVVGALASTAASAVLVGVHLHLLGAGPAAFTLFSATFIGLIENVVISSL